MIFRILALGDVAGPNAAARITRELFDIRREYRIDFVVCNGENSAATNGIDVKTANDLIKYGVDCITTGNHTFKRREIREYLDETKNIVRPGNFPPEVPGTGYTILPEKGMRILVMNVLGLVYLEPLSCPFRTVEKMLKAAAGKYDISILDIHAEATSEKITFAHYLDGRVTAVVGTHTHVQTSDAVVLPGGTAFQTDLGMTGPWYSSIGRDFRPVLQKFLSGIPARFDVAEGPATLEGAVITFDPATKRASAIAPFRYREPLA